MGKAQVKIKIPKRFSSDDAEAIAEELVDYIIERTKKGHGADGKFPGYSDSYKKSFEFKVAGKSPGKVNLTLSGEMLDSLSVISATSGEIVIGYEDDDPNSDKAEGNILGSYGGEPDDSKARNFLEVKEEEVARIIRRVAIEMEDGGVVFRPKDISKASLKKAIEIVDDFEFDEGD